MIFKQLRPERVFILSVIYCIFFACNQPSSSEKQAVKNEDAGTFQFSAAAKVEALSQDEDNWCRRSFSEGILIAPDPADANRRLFLMSDGVYKIVVQQGSGAGTLMLRRSREKGIEVFTAENFPGCLYSKTNCSLTNGGSTLVYDNQKKIRYTLEAKPVANGLQVIVNLDSNCGLMVHRCLSCI